MPVFFSSGFFWTEFTEKKSDMKGKIKSQYAGLFLIFIMFFSTFAFAIISSVTNQSPEATPTPGEQQTVERHTKRLLTETEKASVLRNGMVVFEFLQSADCPKCAEYRPVIEGFALKYNMVLVDAPSTNTTIQFIGKSSLRVENVTENGLLDAYCTVSFIQPKECVLKNF